MKNIDNSKNLKVSDFARFLRTLSERSESKGYVLRPFDFTQGRVERSRNPTSSGHSISQQNQDFEEIGGGVKCQEES